MLKVGNDGVTKAWKPFKTWQPFYKGGKVSKAIQSITTSLSKFLIFSILFYRLKAPKMERSTFVNTTGT